MKVIFETVAAIGGAVTFALLAFSVTHEYGYFLNVGPQFQTFVSTSDYFVNAILWLPFTVLIFGWGDWSQLREDREPKKRSLREWRTWFWPAFGFLWLMVQTAITAWPPGWGYLSFLLVMFLLLWANIWRQIVQMLPTTDNDLTKAGRTAIRLGIPMLAGAFVLGNYNAASDLKSFADPYVLKIKGSDEPQLRILLRNLDKGLLVLNTVTKQVEFRRWDEISSVAKPIQSQSRSFVCWAFAWCNRKELGVEP